MRTLTEVFTPGAPTLPEGLRTLVVSPERELEPGMTVRASFTFRNQGGAPATGVRVRMNLPEGLVYLVGTGQLDGVLLDDDQGNCPLLARNGAAIGDVAPAEERRIEIAYSVAGAIENGTAIELQAAVSAFEIAPVGSNIVRLIARSNPVLSNPLTIVTIEARPDPHPGREALVTLRVHNAGESSAHDVVAVLSVPAHTSYVPNSALVNGRELETELRAPFDRVYAPVIAKTLPSSATVTVNYRVRIDDPLPDGTIVLAQATIASQETSAVTLEPAALTVVSRPRFDDDQTSFSVEPWSDVQPGQRITLRLRATNAGTAAAQNAAVTLTLADGLLLVRGASRLDGRPLREKKKEAASFDLGRIDAHASVELSADAIVASPAVNGAVLPVVAQLTWDQVSASHSAERSFERTVVVQSQPFFAPRRNSIERSGGGVAHPGEEVEAAIVLTNDGSAPATDLMLHLHADPALDDVTLLERNTRLPLSASAAELDRIDPYASRRFTVRARIRSPFADRSEIALRASAHCRELGETPLGEVRYHIDSHPLFSAGRSAMTLTSDGVLRPNELAEVYIRLCNQGTDTAHDVRLRLYISPEARLESVDGATREKSALLFGEIAPGATVEARLGLRLMRGLAREFPVTIDAILSAAAMLPVPLERLTIETTAEPDFSVGVLRSEPSDAVDVGEAVEYIMHLRNSGDGPARRVQLTIAPQSELIYVPNSTTVNDIPIRDVGAAAPFASERGIVLNDVDPGVEATIRWRDVVHNGLPAGESIVRVAHIRYDGERQDDIVSAALSVRSAPSFANNITGLPFGVDGMIGPSFAGSQRALTEERYVELPPATPVARIEARSYDQLEPSANGESYLALDVGADELYENGETRNGSRGEGIAVAREFDDGSLERTLRFLDEARFGGLVSHLFAVRAFLPTAIGIGEAQAGLRHEREMLRDALDRLFIKLRLPHYVIAPRDIETPQMRAGLTQLLDRIEGGTPRALDGTRETAIGGHVRPADLAHAAGLLNGAALSTAAPWYALATLVVDGAPEIAAYRTALLGHLEAVATREPTAFIDALQREATPELDAALDRVKDALAVRS
ncbi:MAG: hypothetical protein JOZ38_01785 [Candidatus Eremiobacteraeota bacterium]|nr:hypothetical protein [Candidatus Eremiobacteraeota bacterium]